MPLFEVAVLEMPTQKEAEEGKSEKLVFGPSAVEAKDSQTAGIVALKGVDGVDFNKAQVLVRPFVSKG